MPRNLFRDVLWRIDELRPRPAPTWAGAFHGRVQNCGREVRLDDEKQGQVNSLTRSNLQKRAIGRLRRQSHSDGGGIRVQLEPILR